jgi:Rv0078B-related antitoxin
MPAEVRRAGSAFLAILTRLRRRWAGAVRATAKDAGPEAVRVQAALDMHELGVRLYRQRMHREHPEAHRSEIDGMVRAWLAEPPPSGHLRLPSGEQDRGIR